MTEFERYAGTPVLVLGASGFIGRWVSRLLSASGSRITAAVRDPERSRQILAAYGVEGEIVGVDLADPRAVTRLLTAARPAITFNLAGYGVDPAERDESTSSRINADLVGQVADLVERHSVSRWSGLSLVHTGSALEYGDIGGDLDEAAEPHPTTLYGRTKLAGTRRLAGHGAAVTARLFTVYGPGEHAGRLVPTLLQAAGRSDPVPLSDGRQRRDFTYVEDVALGLLRLGLARSAAGGVLNLASGKLHSVREFVQVAARVLRIPDRRLEFGAVPLRAGEMVHEPVAVNRLQSTLGWVPDTSVEEGVGRTQRFLLETAKFTPIPTDSPTRR